MVTYAAPFSSWASLALVYTGSLYVIPTLISLPALKYLLSWLGPVSALSSVVPSFLVLISTVAETAYGV